MYFYTYTCLCLHCGKPTKGDHPGTKFKFCREKCRVDFRTKVRHAAMDYYCKRYPHAKIPHAGGPYNRFVAKAMRAYRQKHAEVFEQKTIRRRYWKDVVEVIKEDEVAPVRDFYDDPGLPHAFKDFGYRRRCAYCFGWRDYGVDHIPPLWVLAQLPADEDWEPAPEREMIAVPQCHHCFEILEHCPLGTFAERKAFVEARRGRR